MILSSFHSFYFILLFRSNFHQFIFQLIDSFFDFRYSAIDSFSVQFSSSSLSLGSRYEYAKDFHLFTDYLRKVFSEEVDDQLIIHLEKQDYQNFLAKIYRHTRSFQTTANQETEQLFENSYYGISRKQYSLNHFLRFLYQKGLIDRKSVV